MLLSIGNCQKDQLLPAVEIHYWVPTLFVNYDELNIKADYGKERFV